MTSLSAAISSSPGPPLASAFSIPVKHHRKLEWEYARICLEHANCFLCPPDIDMHIYQRPIGSHTDSLYLRTRAISATRFHGPCCGSPSKFFLVSPTARSDTALNIMSSCRPSLFTSLSLWYHIFCLLIQMEQRVNVSIDCLNNVIAKLLVLQRCKSFLWQM